METLTFGGTGLLWGGILAAAMVGYGLVFRLARLDYRSVWRFGFYVLPPVAGLAAQLSWGRAGGAMAYADGFSLATIVVAMGTLAHGLYVYAYNRWIDDSLIQSVVRDRTAQVEARVSDPIRRARSQARLEALGRPGRFAASVTVFLLLVSIVITAVITVFTT